VRTRRDTVAVALIWTFVLVGAFVLGAKSSDLGGAGETAAGVGAALTGLYFFVRGLRSRDRLISTSDEEIGSATATWLKAVVVIVLWVAGSVIATLARVPDAYAVLLGWLVPLAVFLVYQARRAGRKAA
jgi:hypothetical protein